MVQKNQLKNILRKFDFMSIPLYKKRFIIAILCASILLIFGCKKTVQNIKENAYKKYFDENIMNRTFVVDLAIDTTIDITSLYNDYNFILTKSTSYFDGPMTGTKSGITYTGNWSCNEDFSKLTINLSAPSIPAEFIFLNREWKFTKKTLPVMELAPWGNPDPKVLHMRRL